MSFCKYCGKELMQDQVCDCTMQKQSKDIISISIQKEDVDKSIDFSKKSWNNFLKIMKSPITAGKEFVEAGNVNEAIFFVIVQAIISGIFSFEVVNKMNGLLTAIGYLTSEKIALSKIKALAITTVFSLLLSVLLVVCIMALFKIMKDMKEWDKIIRILGARSAITIPAIALGIIFFMINIRIGIVLYMFSALLGAMELCVMTLSISNDNENKNFYGMFLIMLVWFVAFSFLTVKGGKYYLPASFRSSLSTLPDSVSSVLKYL